MDIVGGRTLRVAGVVGIASALVAGIANLLLPVESEDVDYLVRIAESDTWPLLHVLIVAAVVGISASLVVFVRSLSAASTVARDLALGALAVGTSLMLVAVGIAGTALRKRADEWLVAAPEHNVATFFAATSTEDLAYAVYGVAFVVLLGVMPLAVGAALASSGSQRRWLVVLSVVAGVFGLLAGFVQITVETDTALLSVVASTVVLVWTLAIGVVMWRSTTTETP
jgi:hypothetical protein